MSKISFQLPKIATAGLSAAEFEQLADWHDAHAELAFDARDVARHELISFRLRKAAASVRNSGFQIAA